MLCALFNIFSGIVLLLFAIHYIYYIISAISGYKMQSDDAKYIKKYVKLKISLYVSLQKKIHIYISGIHKNI